MFHQTLCNRHSSFESKSEDREEIAEPLCTDGPAPALEIPEEQDLESQQERTLESQPVHLVIFTCKDTSASGSVDYQFKMLNFELYIVYIDELAIFHSNCNRH